jgi:hypothetical protein
MPVTSILSNTHRGNGVSPVQLANCQACSLVDKSSTNRVSVAAPASLLPPNMNRLLPWSRTAADDLPGV